MYIWDGETKVSGFADLWQSKKRKEREGGGEGGDPVGCGPCQGELCSPRVLKELQEVLAHVVKGPYACSVRLYTLACSKRIRIDEPILSTSWL